MTDDIKKDKTTEKNERPPIPDDDQLANQVIENIKDNFRYFHS